MLILQHRCCYQAHPSCPQRNPGQTSPSLFLDAYFDFRKRRAQEMHLAQQQSEDFQVGRIQNLLLKQNSLYIIH